MNLIYTVAKCLDTVWNITAVVTNNGCPSDPAGQILISPACILYEKKVFYKYMYVKY